MSHIRPAGCSGNQIGKDIFMFETISVSKPFVGHSLFSGCEQESHVQPGDYRIERYPGIGDRFVLHPLSENNTPYVVETSVLKQANALGQMQFISGPRLQSSSSDNLSESVQRMLSGRRLEDEFKTQLKEGAEQQTPIPPGLLGWVNDFKIARINGNVRLAKELKKNIDREIKRLHLDPKAVFGNDPTPVR